MQLRRPRVGVPIVDTSIPGFGNEIAEAAEVFGGAGVVSAARADVG